MADYQEAPLATRPKTLDPNEYFNVSTDQRRVEQSRAALRAELKRQYQTQLNNPHRKELIVSKLPASLAMSPLKARLRLTANVSMRSQHKQTFDESRF